MDTVKRGYYGLAEKPKFEDALDVAKTSLRIPLPDRAAKRAVYSLYREKLLENEKIAAGFELNGYEHRLKDSPVPEAVIHVQPSPSADDALFEEVARQHQTLWENEQQRLMRHKVDAEAVLQHSYERHGDLSLAYTQGLNSHILQGEVPLDEVFTETLEAGAAQGYVVQRRTVKRAAPHNMPQACGRPAHPEFTTFRELNMGQIRLEGDVAGERLPKFGESYESLRHSANVPRDY